VFSELAPLVVVLLFDCEIGPAGWRALGAHAPARALRVNASFWAGMRNWPRRDMASLLRRRQRGPELLTGEAPNILGRRG
jgi:hypothetical protein